MFPDVTDMPGYKERSVHTKFLQQLFLGVGGATVFGLVGAIATAKIALSLTMASLAPIVGLTAIGVGCLYLGSKYLADSVQMDQENQARKIGILSQPHLAQTLVQEPSVPSPKATPVSYAMADEAVSEAPPTWASRLEAAQKIDPASMKAANDDRSWGDKVTSQAASTGQLAAL